MFSEFNDPLARLIAFFVIVLIVGWLCDQAAKPRRRRAIRTRTVVRPVKAKPGPPSKPAPPPPPPPTREEREADAIRIRDREIARAATETDELLRDIRVAAAERRYRERVCELDQE